ncbi:flavin reductase family protein [Crystallibacter degradans]|uniref:flavin reductase family protein n=1 Tax=Crystallibacter degradans TaxID=2726743 RepID=UPI0014735DFA|nr:flavin reductase family protein [Arthrobacter sp. SF27]NMR32026.1 flavin reductase [Arthrobacter sp. SF27]
MTNATSEPQTQAQTATDAAMELSNRVRAVHRQYPTGVTVVTAAVGGKPYGLAVNAFSSISLEPPLVLVCVNESSRSYPAVFESEYIGINILAADQMNVAATFAKSGGDKFAELDWTLSELAVPVLNGVAGHFELEVKYKIPAYSHTIFIGQVVEAASAQKAPLVYQAGKFFDGALLEPVL